MDASEKLTRIRDEGHERVDATEKFTPSRDEPMAVAFHELL